MTRQARRWSLTLVILVVLSLVLQWASPAPVGAAPAGPRIVEATAAHLVFELEVPQPTIEQVWIGDQAFDRITVPGYPSEGEPGRPQLPRIGVTLGIPAEGEVTVRVVDAKVDTLTGAYTVAPAPAWTVQRDSQTGEAMPEAGVQAEFAFDDSFYAQDRFFPPEGATLDETAFVRQQRLARVTLHPVQVNPAQGTLRVFRYLKVELSFSAPQPLTAEGEAAGPADDVFDPLLRAQLLNYDQARPWRSARLAGGSVAPALPVSYPGDTSRPWFKTQVRFSGIYKVTLADLQDPDLAPLASANPVNLQVWKDGQQLPAQFLGDDDAVFEPAEQLLFYADVEPDIYSERDVVWLTAGDSHGMRMGAVDAAPAGSVTDTSLATRVHLEEDSVFLQDVPKTGTPAYPRWYGVDLHSLFRPSRTVFAVLTNPLTGGYNAQFRIRLAGSTKSDASNPDHLVRVELNGQVLGNVTWDGREVVDRQFEFPASFLRNGLNSITLTSPGGLPGVSYEQAYLDWIDLSYRQAPLAASDRLSFQIDGNGRREFEAAGFVGQNIIAYDISIPASPLSLQNLQITSSAAESTLRMAEPTLPTDQPRRSFLPLVGTISPSTEVTYGVRFGQTVYGSRSYLVTTLEAVRNVDPLVRDTGSTLRATARQADYLLITHRSLIGAAEALASYRRSQGLTVAVVEIQDIYDEFGTGQLNPKAIRAFIDYAYHFWQAPAPVYVTLLGDGHYDYRMITGLTMMPNLVPPFFACADPYVCEVAIDNAFVAVSGDDRLPDLAIGRLPANTPESALVMVNKIIDYESTPSAGAWHQTLTFVSDNYRNSSGTPDPAGNFEILNEGVIATIPSEYTIQRVYFDPYPSDDGGEPFRYRTAPSTTNAIVGAVNTGTLFLNYIGHASYNTWAHEAILQASDRTRNDVLLMTNGPRLPVVLDMACSSGNFAAPRDTGIEAKMLERPQGGSVAGWGATGFGVATGHDWLHRGFYQAVFGQQMRAVGPATVAGKLYLWNNGPHYDDLLDTFGLLGDPALRIAIPGQS